LSAWHWLRLAGVIPSWVEHALAPFFPSNSVPLDMTSFVLSALPALLNYLVTSTVTSIESRNKTLFFCLREICGLYTSLLTHGQPSAIIEAAK